MKRNDQPFSQPSDEPLFMAISRKNPSFQEAYRRAAETIPHFIEHVQRGGGAFCSVKLRFRDPDESERLGEDRFVFLWLGSVYYYPDERVFSATFFELPAELLKWHQVGESLVFDSEDVFDWMVIDQGHLHGGFTLRASRETLPETERAAFDRHMGVSVYEPLPT